MSRDDERVREHPEERLAETSHMLDLRSALQELRAEAGAFRRGHRQIALHNKGGASMLLFSFDKDGSLPEHKANGTVVIQAIEGLLKVEAGGETYEMAPLSLLVLAPGVTHSVTAIELSALLVTIQRETIDH